MTPHVRNRGQALVEFSLFAPLLTTILVGAFVAGTGLNDRLVGQGAVREGATVAAQLGAGDRIGTGSSQADIDGQIVATVLGAARRMPYTHLTDLVIYRPSGFLPGGGVDLGRDVYDRFVFDPGNNPTPDPAHQAFLLSLRTSETPDEVPIGVQLDWRYQPGAGSLNIGMTEHAVMWTADESTTVYASGFEGNIAAYDVGGRLITKLVGGGTFEDDGCFDHDHNLLVDDFDAGSVSIFNTAGSRIGSIRATGVGVPAASVESCAVDSTGNIYIGHDNTGQVDEFSATHTPLRSFSMARDQHGIDHMAIKPDGCTLLYTSEGDLVKQYNVCTDTQLADFASLVGQCHQISIRNNGEVFVACFTGVYRLTATGATLQVYSTGSFGSAGILRSVAVDPDGTSFWTAERTPPVIYHVDIQTGGLIKSFPAPEAEIVFGLTVTGQDLDATPGGP